MVSLEKAGLSSGSFHLIVYMKLLPALFPFGVAPGKCSSFQYTKVDFTENDFLGVSCVPYRQTGRKKKSCFGVDPIFRLNPRWSVRHPGVGVRPPIFLPFSNLSIQ
jgi:hypothetical protein